jgi:hypothetical protein
VGRFRKMDADFLSNQDLDVPDSFGAVGVGETFPCELLPRRRMQTSNPPSSWAAVSALIFRNQELLPAWDTLPPTAGTMASDATRDAGEFVE